MHFSSTILLAAASAILPSCLVRGATWNITDSFAPNEFDTAFDYFNDKDPTGGLVLYQTMAEARANNLTGVSNGRYFMRVDTTPVQTEGRRSIRISSKNSYSDGVYVLNVSHVPIGCATWPAFWTVTSDLASYPAGGEIDILENANDQYNGALTTLHTASSCIVPKGAESGNVLSNNCSVYTPMNQACSVVMNGTQTPSWGSAFNAQGGGIVAMERAMGSTGSGVRVWYWSQGQEPSDLQSGSSSVDPSKWGTPGADFNVANNCHSQFGPHKITFDITLCGQLAANTYNLTGCNMQYPACSYQVGYNGSSFNQSYWSLGGLRVFAVGGGTDNAANSPNTHKESTTNAALVFGLSSLPVKLYGLAAAVIGGAGLLLM